MKVWIRLEDFYTFAESKGESRKMYRFCRECSCELGVIKRGGGEYNPI